VGPRAGLDTVVKRKILSSWWRNMKCLINYSEETSWKAEHMTYRGIKWYHSDDSEKQALKTGGGQ